MEAGRAILGRNVSTHGENPNPSSFSAEIGPNLKLGIRRQTLSNITNTVGVGSPCTDDTENACAAESINYVEIMKQNNQLLKILADKNKLIELSTFEIQKLKAELLRAKQHNWQLAQSHSQMLAELNLAKDRLKNMQHEFKGSALVIEQQKKELKEKDNLIKLLTEQLTAHQRKMADVAVDVSLTDDKQKAEPQCKIATTAHVIREEAPKTTTDNRKLLRNVRAPKAQRVNSSNLASCSGGPMHQDKRRRRSTRLLVKIEDEEEEKESEQARLTVKIKEETEECELANGSRRLSVRPLRRAAKKVISYKETPLNVKMRRLD